MPLIKLDVIRNDRPVLVDSFLISAILTVLALRVYLAAAHYPQLGGNGLHIAHVLWGGLLMVVAIGMLLSLLTWPWQRLAALIGGAGFGLFIDELGKFLTSDNNYLFKPTATLIYALFIVLFLLAREVRHFRKLTPRENLVNAIEASKQLALGPVSSATRTRALTWLEAADNSHPLTQVLRRQFELATPAEQRQSAVMAGAGRAPARCAPPRPQPRVRRVGTGGVVFPAVGGGVAVPLFFGVPARAGARRGD